jgi:hypothetical protein
MIAVSIDLIDSDRLFLLIPGRKEAIRQVGIVTSPFNAKNIRAEFYYLPGCYRNSLGCYKNSLGCPPFHRVTSTGFSRNHNDRQTHCTVYFDRAARTQIALF